MELLLTGGAVYRDGAFFSSDLSVSNGRIVSVSSDLPREGSSVIQVNNCLIFPGFVDVHVHLREPGFSYKETIASGSAAAAAGGYTAVCAMPNLNPVPDSRESLREEQRAIRRSARVRVYPYGAITVGQKGEELADLAGMAADVIAFSDDGHGVQEDAVMERAMERARELDKPIVAHCEVNALLRKGGCVHDGCWAHTHGFPGISSESEWKMVERDLKLVRKTRCQYHICHVSTKESVALIRQAKAEGLAVTCETAPHYLLLCEDDLQDEGRFKMNPPVRAASDRAALLEGVRDGTVDCIATDHAPHAAAEKSRGLRDSAFGIVGLETAFPLLYTNLVQTGLLSLEKLTEALCLNPRKIFRLPGGTLEPGEVADLTVINPHASYAIDPADFRSQGRATPFAGWPVDASVALTVCGGEVVYENPDNRRR